MEIQRQFPTSRAYFDTAETVRFVVLQNIFQNIFLQYFIVKIVKIKFFKGLGSIYLFRSHTEIKSFDRYSNSGYNTLRVGHQCDIGTPNSNEYITNRFDNRAQSYSSRYHNSLYVCL